MGLTLDAEQSIPTYLWTGASGQGNSVQDAANWQTNSPAVPTGDGSEVLVFGEINGSTEEQVLIPLSAAFKDISFTGTDRPRYIFNGSGGQQLVLTGNVTATMGGDNRSVTLASSLELGLTPGAHTVDVDTIVSVFAKVFDHDGVASIVKKGLGGLYLSGTDASSTFSGGVTVEEGILFLSRESVMDGGVLVSGPAGTGILTLKDATSVYAFDGFVGIHNPVSLPGGTATLNGISDCDSLDLRGAVSGAGALKIQGDGEFRLSGANTYSGGTVVESGTLVAGSGNDPLGVGNVTVNSGGTLRLDEAHLSNAMIFNPGSRLIGNGSILTATLGNGVTFSPGGSGAVSVGTYSFNDLTLMGGGNIEWTLRNASSVAGTGWDVFYVTTPNTLTIASNAASRFNLKLFSSDGEITGEYLPTGFNPNQAASWLIFGTSGIEITGGSSLADSFTLDASGFAGVTSDLFSLTRVNNDLFITFTPVPEPSTYVLLTMGLAALGARAWRRRR